jgi:HAMP domain-containing protein
MIDMLVNLSIFLAGAGTSGAIGYALWRTITRKPRATRHARHRLASERRIAQANAPIDGSDARLRQPRSHRDVPPLARD